MLEATGDIFSQPDADAICFTSNGMVKQNGELVMGAGIAKQFRDRYPGIAMYFGQYVRDAGSHVYANPMYSPAVISFPTKRDWRDPSDIMLVKVSAMELAALADYLGFKHVYLPPPGCGLGGLNWAQVRTAISPILDNRFTVLVSNK